MRLKRNPSHGLATIALVVSCVLLGQAFARADTITTFDVSGQYSIELSTPTQGTFSGTLKVDMDSIPGTLTAVDIKFDAYAAEFNSLSENSPTGDNWEFTAYDFVGDKLELTFAPFPNPGSLVNLVEGVIISGQVLDHPGDIALFPGLSGSITPATSVPPVPEPPSVGLLALGSLAFGFVRRRGILQHICLMNLWVPVRSATWFRNRS